MTFNYSNIEDFENKYNNLYLLNQTECSCGAYFEMQLEDVEVQIDRYGIHLNECPIMVCDKCGEKHLCPNI